MEKEIVTYSAANLKNIQAFVLGSALYTNPIIGVSIVCVVDIVSLVTGVDKKSLKRLSELRKSACDAYFILEKTNINAKKIFDCPMDELERSGLIGEHKSHLDITCKGFTDQTILLI